VRKAQSKHKEEQEGQHEEGAEENNNKQCAKCHLSMAKEFGIWCGKLQNVVDQQLKDRERESVLDRDSTRNSLRDKVEIGNGKRVA